jgi:hypothetical protein
MSAVLQLPQRCSGSVNLDPVVGLNPNHIGNPDRRAVKSDCFGLRSGKRATVSLHDQSADRTRIEREEPIERYLLGCRIAGMATGNSEEQPGKRIRRSRPGKPLETRPCFCRAPLVESLNSLTNQAVMVDCRLHC